MTRPRVGFLGVGWIGRHRMEAMIATGTIEVAAITDVSAEMAAAAHTLAPQAALVADLDEMLAMQPDGIVIATPSALHAEQAIDALGAGAAVFCQKPLGRSAAETQRVVDAARRADRLLMVDLSYRYTAAMTAIAELVRGGEVGPVHAIDLTFHNAYGPNKPWFFDRAQSGGGCVIDLGVHLVDLALWTLDFPAVEHVSANLFAQGTPLVGGSEQVEDYAVATLTLATGAVIRLACSWHLHAGQDAVIEASFYGRDGGARFVNRDGSFYDFVAERAQGTTREALTTPPDDWGARAAADWAMRLAAGERFDPSASMLTTVADVLDRIYSA